MKWILAPLLLLTAMTVSADDAYQRGYQMGADLKAYQEGWEAAQKEVQPSDEPKSQTFAEFREHRKLKEMTFIQANIDGTRLDFTERDKTFKSDKDGIKGKTSFEILDDGIAAKIYITGNKNQSETADGVVLQQTAEMVVIATTYGAQKRLDKIDVYTLYPSLGIGFLNITHAYGGTGELGKALAEAGKGYPSASSITIPLKLE